MTLRAQTVGRRRTLGRRRDTVRQSMHAPPAPPAPGVVERAGVRCRFGARWREYAQHVACLAGVCDDGRAREIALRLPSGVVATERVAVVLAGVEGQDGWAHPRWEWEFRRCSNDPGARRAELDR